MILCLGLTPALQRTLLFNTLELNEVNRASRVAVSAAGKALNTARALATLGIDCAVSGFNGGHTGERVNRFLDEYGVDSVMTPMRAETRICSTLIDETGGSVTELVEEAPQPSAAEIDAFVAANLALIARCRMLVISGTLPPFAGDDFYRPFAAAAATCGVPVVIDSHKSALLGVLCHRPLMAKLNLRELEATYGAAADSDAAIEELLGHIISAGARSVFMTRGGDEAWLVTEERVTKLRPPAIAARLNPIGSGDCTTAGAVCKLARGGSLEEAARFGLACGSANAETLFPADFTPARAEELFQRPL